MGAFTQKQIKQILNAQLTAHLTDMDSSSKFYTESALIADFAQNLSNSCDLKHLKIVKSAVKSNIKMLKK